MFSCLDLGQVTAMMTFEDARGLVQSHLGDGLRARHSMLVGYLLRRVAQIIHQDADLWQITGICHDLDFDVTKMDRSSHGVVTARWLAGKLPPDALLAIQAHDHRTGIAAQGMLASALRLTDALAVAELDIGRGPLLESLKDDASLPTRLSNRPYLAEIILREATAVGLDLSLIGELYADAPAQ